MEKTNRQEQVKAFLDYLEREERSSATRKQYGREICRFLDFLGERELSKEVVIAYKQRLESAYRPVSVNTKLAALNGFFSYLGKQNLHLKLVKIQHKIYCPAERELSKEEYLRLVQAARKRKDEKLALLLQTLGGTGIRVSELRYVTAEAVRRGEAVIHLKGKSRVVLLSGKLRRALRDYLQRKGILAGPVFVTRTGQPLDRSNIWKLLKSLCREAGVTEGKVFPHNLRHLFARTFYSADKDIAKLADLLGHSSIDTTRIYIISSGREHRRQLDALGLVV